MADFKKALEVSKKSTASVQVRWKSSVRVTGVRFGGTEVPLHNKRIPLFSETRLPHRSTYTQMVVTLSMIPNNVCYINYREVDLN